MMTESPLSVTGTDADPTAAFVHSNILVACIPVGSVAVAVQVRMALLKPSASRMLTGLGTDSNSTSRGMTVTKINVIAKVSIQLNKTVYQESRQTFLYSC